MEQFSSSYIILNVHDCDITGVWGVGLATPAVQVDSVPLGNDQNSWVLTSEGTTMHNGEVISRLKVKPEEGSIVVSEMAWWAFSSLSLPLSFSLPTNNSLSLLLRVSATIMLS